MMNQGRGFGFAGADRRSSPAPAVPGLKDGGSLASMLWSEASSTLRLAVFRLGSGASPGLRGVVMLASRLFLMETAAAEASFRRWRP